MDDLAQMAEAALARPAKQAAIEYEGRWYDWGTVRDIAQAVNDALDASGLQANAPVAFVPRNTPAAIAALLALLSRRRTIAMIYAFQSTEGIARDIANLKPAAIVADEQDLDESLRQTLAEAGVAAVALGESVAAAAAGLDRATAQAEFTDSGSPQIQLLTSGTTGPPKRFAVSYDLVLQHFVKTSPLAARAPEEVAAVPPGLLFFPVGNISGVYSTVPPMVLGQRVVLLSRFSLDAWRDYVVRHRPVHSGLPPSYVQMAIDADIPKEELSSLECLGIGAAPLDPEVQKAFEDKYDIPILISYGATEFGGPVAMMTPALHAQFGREKIGTVGRAIPGAAIRVVDPDTHADLPAGQVGLLQVISPRIGPDWMTTSDMGRIDADGFLFLAGRADAAIMRGGFKILPAVVEDALRAHPAVAEAVVVGLPDARLGQLPCAAVKLIQDVEKPTADELEAFVRTRVLATHVPARWRFVDDWPRTPSLKVDRPAIVRQFQKAEPEMEAN